MPTITGNNKIDSLLAGPDNRWNKDSAYGTAVSVSFSFAKALPAYADAADPENQGFSPFSAEQQAAARAIFTRIGNEFGITFTEVPDSAAGNGAITLFNTSQGETSAGAALYPFSSGDDNSGDVYINGEDPENLTNLTQGTVAWATLVHEIGHAIGLKHPGNYNAGDNSGSAGEPPFLAAADDSVWYTVMSYNEAPGGQQRDWFGMLDLQALGYLYGKKETAIGNDTYAYTDAAGSVLTIINDSAGVDLIDLSAVTQGMVLDLRAGSTSSIGLFEGAVARNTLSIAIDSVVENAIGTVGNDDILGNDSNNSLQGGKGNDTLTGGGGTDTAVYSTTSSTVSLTWSADSWRLDAGATLGTDTLNTMEVLEFTNRNVIISSAAHQSYSAIPDDLWFFFLAAFNGAPGVTYMDWMLDRTGNGKSIESFVDVFVTAPQFKDVYPESMSELEFATKLVQNTLKGTAASVYEKAALDKIVNMMNSGADRGDVIFNAIGDMKWVSASSPIWGQTAQLFEKQKTVAKFYTDQMSQNTTDADTLRSVIANVAHDTDISTEGKIIELIGISLLDNFNMVG